MKKFLLLICSLSLGSVSLAGEYQYGYSRSRTCTSNEYREEYIPGTRESPGYVRSWTEIVEVPCNSVIHHRHRNNHKNILGTKAKQEESIDNNDCKEGSIIGALLGAGLTMTGTRGKDRWWAVPAGGTAGAIIGCQLDGG